MLALVVRRPFLRRGNLCLRRRRRACPSRRNRPRWFTKAPRLVETVTSGEVVTMRSASVAAGLGEVEQDAAERGLGRLLVARRARGWRGSATEPNARSRLSRAMRLRSISASTAGPRIVADAFERLPFLAFADAHRLAQRGHLRRVHQPGMIVLVAGEGQAVALDRPGDEQGRRRRPAARVERLDQAFHAMAAEVGEQRCQRRVVMGLEERRGCFAEIALRSAPAIAAPPW